MRAKGRIEKLERVLGVNEEQNKTVVDLVYESDESDESKWKSEGYVKEGDSWVRYINCGRNRSSRGKSMIGLGEMVTRIKVTTKQKSEGEAAVEHDTPSGIV